jgi:acyl-lipid omega-6 desaturase (Delta-12 desaturase)
MRSTVELVITAVPLVILWILMWAVLGSGYWVGLLLAVPAAGLPRAPLHDPTRLWHGSFFRRRLANDWVGRVIGVLTLTPYDFWRHSHALHHANSGNLDHRGFGDVDTLTVREFLALSRWRQLMYRLYRNPIVMFGVGPMYLFVLQHRLPVGLMRSSWHFWLSTMAPQIATKICLLLSAPRMMGGGSFLRFCRSLVPKFTHSM